MAPINIQQSSIFFLILFFAIFSFSTSLAIAHDPSEVFSKYISPSSLGLKREKLSHLHFYLHDISAGKNATAVRVAEAPSSNTSSSSFGVVVMMDDPLTIKPDLNSTMVGRAQGMYAFASQSDLSLLMVLNFAFTHGKFNGSTLSVLGRNKVLSSVREMPIVGGSGVFRFARGYAQAKTYSNGQVESIVEYNKYAPKIVAGELLKRLLEQLGLFESSSPVSINVPGQCRLTLDEHPIEVVDYIPKHVKEVAPNK